jgi:LPS sulfotransferase NodH
MKPHRTVIVCTTPRSGSTLLCALLASSGTGGRPESWYRAEDRAEYEADWGVQSGDASAFLAAAIKAGSDDSGTFGIRLQASSLSPVLAELRGIFGALPDRELLQEALGPCTFIHIRREDDVAQAVSRLKAEVSQVWHMDGTETASQGEAVYDAERLDQFRAEAAEGNTTWEAWFAANGIAPTRVVYEQFVADPPGQVRTFLVQAGLPPHPDRLISAPNRKMADAASAAWASQYRQDRGLEPMTEGANAL